MGSIEKALEKAKRQRKINAEAEERVEVGEQTPFLERPIYTQTRQVPLDKSCLMGKRIYDPLCNPTIIDGYNLLRTQVLQKTRDSGSNTILITSTTKGEGKTLTAINLAISISREVAQTVLLVDADLRHPTVQKYFDLKVEVGLSDYLLHDIPIPDLLINPGIDKLIILPGGKAIPGSTEILGSPKMAELVQEMKTRYKDRYLIFDCSPLLVNPDSLIFSSYVDGIILVVEAGKTTTDQVKKAMEFLKGRNLLGTVLNKAGRAETYYP